MKYNDIINAVKTAITNGSTGLSAVYSELQEEFSVYPHAVILPIGHTNEIRDMAHNVRTYRFLVRVAINIEGQETAAQIKLRDLVDKVIDVLEDQDNIQLSGVIDWAEATDATFRLSGDPAKHYFGEITYSIKVRFNRRA